MTKEICIIDDDTIYQFLMRKIMLGTEVKTTAISYKNGKDAIESFTSSLLNHIKLPDIILLDIEMPFMNGWDFMNQMELLLDNYKITSTEIYIVSSSISYEDIEKAKLFKNISGYFSKPISVKDLNKIIQ